MAKRNILSLTSEEKQQFLDSFDYIFSDIDGVVWNLLHNIEGSADGFRELCRMGKHLTFVTNNSVRSEMQCLQKLHENHIDIESENVMHPAKSIVEYLKSIEFEGLLYVLASEEFKKVLRQAGYELIDGPNVIVHESVSELLALALDTAPVKAVIIDFDFNLTFLKMMKAKNYLRQPDCLLIGGVTDSQLPIKADFTILGPGPFAKILEQSSGKRMLTFGKPGKALADLLMQRCNISKPKRVLMIGDMLKQDIYFATSCGFQSLLVLSGGSSYDELLAQTDPKFSPDYYAQSIADFVQFMQDLEKNNL